MPKLTQTNAIEWTRAKTAEMARFIESEFGVENLVSDMKLLVSLSSKRTTSRGGIKRNRKTRKIIPWMSLGIWHYTRPLRTNSTQNYIEYKSIANHPVIGEIRAATAEVQLAALIAHELAHAVDYYTMRRWGGDAAVEQKINNELDMSVSWADGRHREEGGHGARWQAIYALLRAKFVNGGVKDPNFTVKTKKKTAKKDPNKGKYAGLTVRLVNRRGKPYRYYSYKGEMIAVGFPIFNYSTWGAREYKLVAIENGQCTDELAIFDSGKAARPWILENML